MSLLLTLNRFHTLFWCAHCCLWASNTSWERYPSFTGRKYLDNLIVFCRAWPGAVSFIENNVYLNINILLHANVLAGLLYWNFAIFMSLVENESSLLGVEKFLYFSNSYILVVCVQFERPPRRAVLNWLSLQWLFSENFLRVRNTLSF